MAVLFKSLLAQVGTVMNSVVVWIFDSDIKHLRCKQAAIGFVDEL